MRDVTVWDLPTRVFHWALVVVLSVAYLTGGEEGRWFTVHVLAAYAVAALLLFRAIWGIIGSPRSRFSDFVHGWPAVRDYAAKLARLAPPRSIGHNPLGGWMVVALLAVLAATVATGLVAGERGEAAGPLLGVLVPLSLGDAAGEVHELLANLVLALAVAHVAAVFVDWALTGENLVASMIHGRKTLDHEAARREPAIPGGGRAIAVAMVLIVLAAIAIANTDFGALADAGAHPETSLEHDEER